MNKTLLGNTDINLVPLVFGGNVFGWTIDEKTSFEILDAFVDAGFNAIDTADVYSAWAPGNQGGESETILGNWFKARPGMREKVSLFTKVGSEMGSPDKKGLSKRWIMQAVEDSLRRLQTDYIDLYFSHWPDENTPYEETLSAYETLMQQGKIRAIGASNLNAKQLYESLKQARSHKLPTYQVLQPEYNLYDRDGFNRDLQTLCLKENIGVVTYFSLASGFLSGKYRSHQDLGQSQRGQGIEKYLNAKGFRILNALDDIAEAQNAQPAHVALAWLIAQQSVTAPIVSATKREHVEGFVKAMEIELSDQEISVLTEAGL
ncbi:aldo/keto reductase [Vibrio olivae]|uniref:Aldo/keto reductase n=1 Tax=Vibrio olivae TaxID=1243002 RepID=A0ABV5HPD5_9VIBR